jgi:signal transduction histidine kinase
MFTNESLLTKKHMCPANNDFERMLGRLPYENQAILSRVACEISNSFTLIDSQIQLIKAHNPQLQETKHWDQLSIDAQDISHFLHDFSTYIHSEQLNTDETNLTDLFTDIVDLSAEKASDKSIDLSILVGEPCLLCLTNYLCDGRKMEHAITNIINWLIDISELNRSIQIKLPSTEEDFYLHSNGTRYVKIQFLAEISSTVKDLQESVYQPISGNRCICTNLSTVPVHFWYCHSTLIVHFQRCSYAIPLP